MPQFKVSSLAKLFLFYENINFIFFTASCIKPNHFLCAAPAKVLKSLSFLIKGELHLSTAQLVEATAVDLSFYSTLEASFSNFLNKHKKLLSYSFYFYFFNSRLTFFFTDDLKLQSIDSTFLNANWLERELSEMYGIFFFKKVDQRNLLLDYCSLESPMLKSYASVGVTEVVYDYLNESCVYNSSSVVEL